MSPFELEKNRNIYSTVYFNIYYRNKYMHIALETENTNYGKSSA